MYEDTWPNYKAVQRKPVNHILQMKHTNKDYIPDVQTYKHHINYLLV